MKAAQREENWASTKANMWVNSTVDLMVAKWDKALVVERGLMMAEQSAVKKVPWMVDSRAEKLGTK